MIHDIKYCTKCELHKYMPKGCRPVPGAGPTYAKIMIVGEALGEDEAILEKPFCGRCGMLLNKMLSEAGLERKNLFITNTVHCRPVKDISGRLSNRPPSKDEIAKCKDWVFMEIDYVKPELIFTLGMVPTKTILSLKSGFKMKELVGIEHSLNGIKVVPVYHPSYVMAHSRKDYNVCVDIFKKYKELI